MGRMHGIVLLTVVGSAAAAQADVVQYTIGGVTSNVAVFGFTWATASTGDPWELVISVDTTIPEDNSTVDNPNAYRVFDSLISASLTIGIDSAPIVMFGDDLIFTNDTVDSLFFSAFEPGGGTMVVQIDGPDTLFGESKFPTSIDQASLSASRFFVNAFIQDEVGIFGDATGGTFTAQAIPSPMAPLALVGGLGLFSRRRR